MQQIHILPIVSSNLTITTTDYSEWPYLDLVKEERELIVLDETSTNQEYKKFIKFKLANVIAELDSRL